MPGPEGLIRENEHFPKQTVTEVLRQITALAKGENMHRTVTLETLFAQALELIAFELDGFPKAKKREEQEKKRHHSPKPRPELHEGTELRMDEILIA